MDELLAKDTARLADLMGSAERCVVLTGVRMGATEETEAQAAGSSWSEISSIEVLLADPARFWEHWLPRALEAAERTPRVEHEAIARLQRSGVIKGLITLGVDDLHRKGGSPEVVEVHANVMSCRCSRCDDVYALGEVVGLLQRSEDGVPRCTRDDCTFPLRPTGTLWGEPLVEAAVIKAWDLAQNRAVTGNARDDPIGHTGLGGQIAQHARGERSLDGGLHDDGTSRRHRRAQLPQHEGHREVPRGDGGDHANGRGAHDAAGAQIGTGKLHGPEALGLGGEVVHHLAGAGHLGPCLTEGLPLLAVDELGQLGLVRVEHHRVLAHDRRAAQGSERLPRRKSGAGLGHSHIHILGAPCSNLGNDLTGGAVVNGEPLRRLNPIVADNQRVPRHHGAQRFPAARTTVRTRQAGWYPVRS